MEKEIQLDPKEHGLEMLLEMKKLREYCDFTIKAGSEEIPVHKHVLAASSPYFKAMLSHDNLETRSGVVEIKEADAESVKKCIDFIYTGKASVSDDKRADLMHVAHMLQLHRLCDALTLFLENNLSVETVFNTKRLADTYDFKSLGEKCDEFAFKNFSSLIQTEEFKDLNGKYFEFLITSEAIAVSEKIKCEALLKWTNADQEKRIHLFKKILNDLDLLKIPLRFRRHLVKNEKLIYESNDILRRIALSLCDSVCASRIEILTSSGTLLGYEPDDGVSTEIMKIEDTRLSCGITCAVLLDTNMYALLTNGSNFCLNIRNIKGQWRQVAKRSLCNVPIRAVTLQGCIYAAQNQYSNSSAVERYDPRSNKWERIPNRPVHCYGFSMVADNSSLFVIGGIDQSNKSLSCVQKYDASSKVWSSVCAMNTPRHSAVAVETNGKIYVFGGMQNMNQGYGYQYNTYTSFDIKTGTWTNLVNAYLPFAGNPFAGCAVNGEIFILSGNKIRKFNISTGSWGEKKTIPFLNDSVTACFAITCD